MDKLLIKDFMIMKKHLWIAIVYSGIVFFMFRNPQTYVMVYAMGITMIAYIMIMYVTAYDDKNNSEVILNSLPISREKIVISRYVSVFLSVLISIISMAVMGYAFQRLNILEGVRLIRVIDIISALIAVGVISFLFLPIYFKFGYIKAKMFNLLVFAICFAGPSVARKMFGNIKKPQWVENFANYVNNGSAVTAGMVFLGGMLILGLISLTVSIYIYKRRDF